jgi:hypothetical protein
MYLRIFGSLSSAKNKWFQIAMAKKSRSANRTSTNYPICGRSANLKKNLKFANFADLRLAELICGPPKLRLTSRLSCTERKMYSSQTCKDKIHNYTQPDAGPIPVA